VKEAAVQARRTCFAWVGQLVMCERFLAGSKSRICSQIKNLLKILSVKFKYLNEAILTGRNNRPERSKLSFRSNFKLNSYF